MKKQSCPVCGNDRMSVFLMIEGVPLHCNLLWSSYEEAIAAPRGDIRLGFCELCGMIYNVSFDPTKMQYTQGYETSLHFSPHFQHYAKELATRLIEKYQLYGKEIIEIGCGDGEFLSMLCEGGRNRGIGFDPSYPRFAAVSSTMEYISFVPDQYSHRYADYRADFACARHVLEHIQSPREFLSKLRLKTKAGRKAVLYFEVPNGMYTFRDLGIWDIIYEHCSYFVRASLTDLFEACGFRVLDIYETYHGQFLGLEATRAERTFRLCESQTTFVDEIAHLVSGFDKVYREITEQWREELQKAADSGLRIALWGAGSKGITFLNSLRANDQVRYIVDINPRKQGLYVPGTGHRVVPPEFLQGCRPDIIIAMNPVYVDEIRRTIRSLEVEAEIVSACGRTSGAASRPNAKTTKGDKII